MALNIRIALLHTHTQVMSITNTWVGAVVGAVPPLIGWAAAKGEGMDLHASFATTKPGADEGRTPYRKLLAGIDEPAAYVLPALLYFWQLPHFMSLAWMCRSDYALGGYRMLPLLDPAGTKTAFVCMRNCMYLLPVGFIGVSSCLTSYPFAIGTRPTFDFAGAAVRCIVADCVQPENFLFPR